MTYAATEQMKYPEDLDDSGWEVAIIDGSQFTHAKGLAWLLDTTAQPVGITIHWRVYPEDSATNPL